VRRWDGRSPLTEVPDVVGFGAYADEEASSTDEPILRRLRDRDGVEK
jgi:hypothetical protein